MSEAPPQAGAIPQTPPAAPGQPADGPRLGPTYLLRTAIAGVLMGIANLIPGVSGGTMILALGVYEDFITAVAELSAFRLRLRPIVFLTVLSLAQGLAIVLLAGVVLYLLFFHTAAMFALFVGLTLGGVPLLLSMIRPLRTDVIVAMVAGLSLMIGVAMLRHVSGGLPHNTAIDLLSGLVGSTTMVLPGISGSYMLLVMDQYDRIVGAVRDLKDAAAAVNPEAVRSAARILLPVAIGAVVGIVALSNLLKWLLHRYHRVTLGVLLGILLGSVIMLWPFSQGVGHKALERRSPAELKAYAARNGISGCDALDDRAALVECILDNWDRRTPPPVSAGQYAMALVVAAMGFGVTTALSRIGKA